MSKASQRKRSLYAEGRRDAHLGSEIRWIRHPQIKSYLAGYHSVLPRKRKLPSFNITLNPFAWGTIAFTCTVIIGVISL